jgi:hypothetical protein
LNLVFEQDIEPLLVPVKLQVRWQRRLVHMGARLFVRSEGLIRSERDPHLRDARRRQRGVVLVDGDVVGQVELGRAPQRLLGPPEIEIARSPSGIVYLDQRCERYPDQQFEAVVHGPHKGGDPDVGRDVVGRGAERERTGEERGDPRGNLQERRGKIGTT